MVQSEMAPIFRVLEEKLQGVFGFGSKMLGSRLLDTLYSNIYAITIGKVYKSADLAFYNRASGLTQLASSVPTSILQSVTYPTLCKLQDNDEALKTAIAGLCAWRHL